MQEDDQAGRQAARVGRWDRTDGSSLSLSLVAASSSSLMTVHLSKGTEHHVIAEGVHSMA